MSNEKVSLCASPLTENLAYIYSDVGSGFQESPLASHLGSATQCVEHVEKHKTREGHRRVTWCNDVVPHLKGTENA